MAINFTGRNINKDILYYINTMPYTYNTVWNIVQVNIVIKTFKYSITESVKKQSLKTLEDKTWKI